MQANSDQQRFFLVEFILNLADQLLQNIFERDHPHRAAVFVHHNGEMEFPFEEQLQQLLQAGGFGHVNELAGHRGEFRAAPDFQTHREQVLDVHHAQRLVEVARFTKWEAGVTTFFRHVQAFSHARVGVQPDDFLARTHDLADNPPPQVERVEHNVPAQPRRAGNSLGRRDQQPQFLLRMGAV